MVSLAKLQPPPDCSTSSTERRLRRTRSAREEAHCSTASRALSAVSPAWGDAALVTEAARAALTAAQAGHGPVGWAGGTVGAVARDASGLCAAATSTGGMVKKRVGRVGDSPLIGAGTYADDEAGAVSTTGNGEAMIRLCVARSVAERMRAGASADEATRAEIARLLDRLHATGGIIALDFAGRWGLARSTATMSWAVAGELGEQSGI